MPQSSNSLLIVDDDPAIRDVVIRYLSRHGYRVFPESNGQGALEWIDSNTVDLVLLDIEMPGMDGLDVLKNLRKAYAAEQLPVIMVSGRTGNDDVRAALAAGANDYITKPIDFPLLLARIKAHLSRKRAEEAGSERFGNN